jgi:hypothetical protein
VSEEHLETDPLPEREADRTNVYTCGQCGKRGHSRRTCGLTPDERKARRHRGRK